MSDSSEIKEKCIHKDCPIELCPRKRPVTTEDGFCAPYSNAKMREAVRVGGKQT